MTMDNPEGRQESWLDIWRKPQTRDFNLMETFMNPFLRKFNGQNILTYISRGRIIKLDPLGLIETAGEFEERVVLLKTENLEDYLIEPQREVDIEVFQPSKGWEKEKRALYFLKLDWFFEKGLSQHSQMDIYFEQVNKWTEISEETGGLRIDIPRRILERGKEGNKTYHDDPAAGLIMGNKDVREYLEGRKFYVRKEVSPPRI